jgi:hypothetical protein
MDRIALLGRLTPFEKQRKLLVRDQQVPDIMTAMLKAHNQYKNEYDKISQDFYAGDGIQTAKKVFKFLKQNVRYKIESDQSQRIMSPSALLALASDGFDCKGYALFSMGVLDSLKRKGLINNDLNFRFASYKLLDEIPHHVFVVIKDRNGNEYFVDPVLSRFNERKTYFHKIDKKPNMPLYQVSGIGAAKQAAAPKPVKKTVLRISLAPARGSFLLLVGLNFMGLATKLKNAFDTKASATVDWWNNLGGDANELLRKVNQGAAKKRLLGDDIEFPSEGQIGVVAAAPAAATVTAAPILIKVAEFLGKIGIDVKEVGEVGKRVLAKQVKNVVEKKLESGEKLQQVQQSEVDKIFNQAEGKKNYLPFIVGGAVALYLIAKK